MFAEHLDIDHPFVDVAELDGAKKALDPVDDLESPPVTDRQDQSQSVIARSLPDRFMKLFLRTLREIGQSADRVKQIIFLDYFRRILFQKLVDQTHEREDQPYETL